jgi:hypothetical protein
MVWYRQILLPFLTRRSWVILIVMIPLILTDLISLRLQEPNLTFLDLISYHLAGISYELSLLAKLKWSTLMIAYLALLATWIHRRHEDVFSLMVIRYRSINQWYKQMIGFLFAGAGILFLLHLLAVLLISSFTIQSELLLHPWMEQSGLVDLTNRPLGKIMGSLLLFYLNLILFLVIFLCLRLSMREFNRPFIIMFVLYLFFLMIPKSIGMYLPATYGMGLRTTLFYADGLPFWMALLCQLLGISLLLGLIHVQYRRFEIY